MHGPDRRASCGLHGFTGRSGWAPELLDRAPAKDRCQGEALVLSGNTDFQRAAE